MLLCFRRRCEHFQKGHCKVGEAMPGSTASEGTTPVCGSGCTGVDHCKWCLRNFDKTPNPYADRVLICATLERRKELQQSSFTLLVPLIVESVLGFIAEWWVY